MKDNILLKAKKEEKINDFLEEFDFNFFKNIDSANHIVFPQALEKKIKTLKSNLRDEDQVYFALKSTKSEKLIETIINNNCGLDVSTIQELELALKLGCKKILAGGPKSSKYLQKALQKATLISLDSFYELDEIIKSNKKCNILIRVNDLEVFGRKIDPKKSKFGFSKKDINKILDKVKPHKSNLNISGIHFHSDGYSPEQKALFFNDIFEILTTIKDNGHNISIIDLGGSFNDEILENPLEFEQYLMENMDKIKKQENSDFLNNQIYNLSFDNKTQTFKGINLTKNKGIKRNINQEIQEVYSTICKENLTFKDILEQTGLSLIIEPGFALTTNCGLSIFSVQGVKEYDKDNLLILNGHKFNISANMFEPIANPYFILLNEKTKRNLNLEKFFLAGSLCREDDLFMSRQILLPKEINKGDLVIFLNTGSYAMSYENCNPQRFQEAKYYYTIKNNSKWEIKEEK